MDLIDRKAAINSLGNTPEEICLPWSMAVDILKSQPSIPAVPLDKLCECLVRKRIGFVDEADGKRLTATLDKALWATLIEEWMEGLDGSESVVQKT